MGIIAKWWKEINFQWWRLKRWFKIRRSYLLYFLSSDFRCRNEQRLESYRNAYQGKRIFIVCNGPSLRPEDLERIHENGDYSFGCNKIHYIFSKTHWRPTFYTMMDKGPLADRKEVIKSIETKHKFFRRDAFTTLRKIGVEATLLNTIDTPRLLEQPQFADDCAKKIYFIETTTYCMIQMAVYMGFKDIYIIGCDNHYSVHVMKDGTRIQTGASSYYTGFGNQTDNQTTVSRIWANDIAYETARKYADLHDINIKNATRGGHLEAFQRVDFDTLFT